MQAKISFMRKAVGMPIEIIKKNHIMTKLQIPQATEFMEQYLWKEHTDQQDYNIFLNISSKEVKI
jgi:hypothetical protein